MFVLRRAGKIILILLVFVIILFKVSTDYYIVRPGSSEPLRELVYVEGGNTNSSGDFYLTTVNQTSANLLVWLYGYFNPYVELVEREEVIPEDMEIDDYRELMEEYMEDSKMISKVVALQNAGYDIEVESHGIEVINISENSPARGILQEGDLIVEVDGKEVTFAEEMVEIVKNREAGMSVELKFKRGDETYTEELKTVERTGEGGGKQAALEVYIRTEGWSPVLPRNIEIDSGEIGGPSAGLMFALEIKNQLTDYDLTGGEKIAGTGTINSEERIGSVGGVRHKMVSAQEEGVRYFFVPRANARIAEYVEEYYDDFDAVIVDDFGDAIEFLHNLDQ